MVYFKKSIENFKDIFRSHKIAEFIDSKCFVFTFSGVLGAVFFMIVFGVKVLNPTYTDWLLIPGNWIDLPQHQLGWEVYRNAAWNFPPGLHNGSTYPFLEAIMFCDPVPLFAIPLKAISFLLPQEFQYLGWFGLLCYFLQGGFGGLIVKKISGCTIVSILCSLFFTMSSFMAYRMFYHTALSANFLILAAIYLCLTKGENRSVIRNSILWGGLLGLTTMIQFYIFPMVLGMMVFCFLDDVIEEKKIGNSLIVFCISAAFVAFLMFIMGVFHSTAPADSDGLGHFSANINSIINTNAVYNSLGAPYTDLGLFLRPLPLTSLAQYEGNSYIGFGMIVFSFIAFFAFIYDLKKYKEGLSDKRTLRRIILTIILMLIFFVFALSPVVALNSRVIIDMTDTLPEFIWNLWSIFRATGRFLWPIVYVTMVVVIWISAKRFKKPVLIVIVLAMLVVQAVDMSKYFDNKGAYFRTEQVWTTPLQSEMWDTISGDFDHFFYLQGLPHMNPVLRFAAHNQMTVNDTYLSRRNAPGIDALKEQTWEQLHNGIAESNTVYIFEVVPDRLIREDMLYVYEFDGLIVGFAMEIDNAENMIGVVRITTENIYLFQ